MLHTRQPFYLTYLLMGMVMFLATLPSMAQAPKPDSLHRLLEKATDKTQIAKLRIELCKIYAKNNPTEAIKNGQEAIEILKKLSEPALLAQAYSNLSGVHRFQGDFEKALQYLLEARKIYETTADQAGIAATYNAIGIIHYYQKDYQQALSNYYKAIDIAEKNKDQKNYSASLNNVGNIYFLQRKYNEALQAFNTALSINQSLGNLEFVANNMSNIASIFLEQKNYDKAKDQYEKALDIHKSINNQEGVAATLLLLANIEQILSNTDKATQLAEQSLEIAQKKGFKTIIRDAGLMLANLYATQKAYEKAFNIYKYANAYQDSLLNQASRDEVLQMQFKYELEKNQSKINMLDLENKQITFIRNSLAVGFAFFAILAYVLFVNYREKRQQAILLGRANAEINQKNEVLLQQNEIIEQKSRDIDSSIHYARRIQDTILPLRQKIKDALPEHFIYWRPRDIVSGDFYWFSETTPEPIFAIDPNLPAKASVFKGFTPEKQIIAAVDCTGHGVPGAFMSMLGSTLLNDIVNQRGIIEPDIILNELHIGIRTALKQKQTNNFDGMDITLCVIDKENRILEFAGAHNPLIYFQEGQLFELPADKEGIGGIVKDKDRAFTKHTLAIPAPTTFYMFSDGYKDQMGGPLNKKIMLRGFKEILQSIHDMPMVTQEELLHQRFQEWIGKEAQIDDILVIGIKV